VGTAAASFMTFHTVSVSTVETHPLFQENSWRAEPQWSSLPAGQKEPTVTARAKHVKRARPKDDQSTLSNYVATKADKQ
jgi:hypothetical protein